MFPRVVAWENLLVAYRKAARGKRGRAPAATLEFQLADRLLELQTELVNETYRPGTYRHFTIHEPKRRLISAAPFRDRVVHHALCNVIEPLFEARFHPHSYANRAGKGTHRAVDQLQAFARRYRYALRLDVVQHFPSLDHAVLRRELFQVIGDERVRRLIDLILAGGDGVLAGEYDMVYFPGDDLFARTRPRGLPIGNLTSQFWANCYLNPFDHFVKRELGCPGYVRYVDDLLLFGPDKATLWRWRQAVVEKLAGLRLTIHPGAQPRPVTEGIPFLGFVVFPDHRRLKRRQGIRYRRRLGALLRQYAAGEIGIDRVHASVRGWINHVRYGDTWRLREAVLGPVVV